MSNLKELFPEYYDSTFYDLSPQELGGYRRWCTFALDANVLLGLYAYSAQARDEFLHILEGIKDRIWLPHQAALEFEKNRISRIKAQITTSRTIRSLLSSASGDIQQQASKNISKIGMKIQHPFLSIGDILDRLTQLVSDIQVELIASEEEYGKLLSDDPIRERLHEIIAGRIGEPFAQDELERIYDEGDRRYKRLQPPGYEDARGKNPKQGVEKFGDLVLWRQLINKGRSTKRSVWLITDDMKEDWWIIEGGTRTGPRVELMLEMKAKASVQFLTSTSGDFYDWAGKYIKNRASVSAIAEARRSVTPSAGDFLGALISELQRTTAAFPSVREMSETIVRMRKEFAGAGSLARLQFTAIRDTIAQLQRAVAAGSFSYLPLWSQVAPYRVNGNSGTDADLEDDGDEDDDTDVLDVEVVN